MMQRITPFLWFNNNAEEAAEFYISIFPNSRIVDVAHYGQAAANVSGQPKGSVMTVTFELDGQEFIALNGGPHYQFSPAISLFVRCKDQSEVDMLWNKLSAGGEVQQCGWLTDKFGVTWQIVPAGLGELLHSHDVQKSERAMQEMLKMKKLDIKRLQEA